MALLHQIQVRVNSMIDEYRNAGWMELTEGMLCHMTTRISTN